MPNNVPPSVDLEEPVIRRAEGGAATSSNATKFSCHLQRDYGKAPCDSDCGKLRCMYPSAPAGKVLVEHSGCGGNPQWEQVSVRLNPGDRVLLVKSEITQPNEDGQRQSPIRTEAMRVIEAVTGLPDFSGDFVEHSHPQYGGGYFCTSDVLERIIALTSNSTEKSDGGAA